MDNNNNLDPILNWILHSDTPETNEKSVSNELLSYLLNDQDTANASFAPILPNTNMAAQAHQQQLGKRKNGHSSPSEEDENDDPTEDQLKLLPSKERRQLRNKISARNFRNRRKEYMATLEERMDKCQAENSQLKLEVKWVRGMMDKLQAENDQLRLELALCKGGIQHPSNITTANVSPPTSATPLDWELVCPSSTPASAMHTATADVFTTQTSLSSSPISYPSSSSLTSASNNINTVNSNIYLAHATVPNWDLSSLFRKETASSVDLIHTYPLLAPALMSIVLQHTMTMTTDDLILNSAMADPTIPSNAVTSFQPRNEDKFMTALSDSALWKTIMDTKPSKAAAATESREVQTTDQQAAAQKLKMAEMKAYIQDHCPLRWLQKQFCIFILFYVVVQYPRLDKPSRTYLPICDKFRIKRHMASLK